MSVDLAVPLRDALLDESAIATKLAVYSSSRAIFTRRPAPVGATYPMIMVSPDITTTDQDGIDDQRPVIQRDIAIYGQHDTPAKYRAIEEIGYLVKALFHRKWRSIVVPSWKVVEVLARGPQVAPADDEQIIGRVVMLTIQLAKKN
jgi:hypothetical protein